MKKTAYYTRMDSEGRITLPEEIIREANLRAGDLLEVIHEDGLIILKPKGRQPEDQVPIRYF